MNSYVVRTSLSTSLTERDMCETVWVQAVWDPPGLVHCRWHQRILEAHGMKVSLVSDIYFTTSKIKAMAENWVQLEYDPNIIDAELYEAIELLENETVFTMPWLMMNIILNT